MVESHWLVLRMSLPFSQSLESRGWSDQIRQPWVIYPIPELWGVALPKLLGGNWGGIDLKENQGSLSAAPTPKLNVEWPSPNSLPDIYAGCAILSLHFLQQSPRRYNIHSSFHPWVCIKTHVHEVATAMFFNHTAKIFKNITHMCFKYRQIAGKAAGFTPACHSEL